MKTNVWILNHYAGRMLFDQGGRHYSFAKYLKRSGYEPVVFCANSKHGRAEKFFNTQDLWHIHATEEIGVPWIFVRARTYTGNGKQRVLNMIDFYWNVKRTAKEYATKYGKPDVIYASSVHPLTLLAGIQLAKRFGVECICEVRDLWPETIVAYSSRFTRNHPLIRFLYQGEKWIYKRADRLIFTMAGGVDYIRERGWEKAVSLSKVYHINNGVDLDVFDYNREHYWQEDPDLDDPETFKVIYAGSIRLVNDLGRLLDAAKKTRDPRIRFLIWGDGDELSTLRKRVEEECISNLVFKGRVEKRYIPSIVSRADLNFMEEKDLPMIRDYGTSSNKIFEYLAAGKPILLNVHLLYSPAEHCGCTVLGETEEEFLRALESVPKLPRKEYEAMCQNARKAASAYDFKTLTKRLIHVLEG